MRKGPFAATLVGVALLVSGLLTSAGASAQHRDRQRSLATDAGQTAAAFGAYFERARSLNLLLAQNPTLLEVAPGPWGLRRASRALADLESLYPGAIGESCLIDERGRELARVTHGIAAVASALSPYEGNNPFFAPTLALPARQVYQGKPYVSPDTHDWVISNSTWVPTAAGRRVIVHFEVSLASFLPSLAPGGRRHVAVVERGSGRILLQTGAPLPPASPAGSFRAASWAAGLHSMSGSSGPLDGVGAVAAFHVIPRAAGNANDLVVIDWTTEDRSGLLHLVGLVSVALGGILIAVAMAYFRRAQRMLQSAARMDHLTGLGNRRALDEALEDAVLAARVDGERIAVLMLDLDGFKQVNDALGHERGDAVLQEIGRRLGANVFEYDTAARVGGDEFAVVLRRLRAVDDVGAVARRLRDALVRPVALNGASHYVGASIGAATFPEHGQAGAEILRAADAAMYRAKRGRDGVLVYEPGTVAGVDALGKAADLLRAIENDEITLAFQPLYSLETGAVSGVEALARWERSDGVTVPPVEFIDLAEQTGLIRALTSATLRMALDEAAEWRRRGIAVPVSVNLSGGILGDPTLKHEILALLEGRGLQGDALVVEVTETAYIQDRKAAASLLRSLREVGIRVELDDFGSGHASFGVLRTLPLDGVKIDRELVADTSEGQAGLVSAIVAMAHRLSLTVVAEGIETPDMFEAVRRVGCDTGQGYHLALPMPAHQLHAVLSRATAPTTGS